jgi:hypothetical protein
MEEKNKETHLLILLLFLLNIRKKINDILEAGHGVSDLQSQILMRQRSGGSRCKASPGKKGNPHLDQ